MLDKIITKTLLSQKLSEYKMIQKQISARKKDIAELEKYSASLVDTIDSYRQELIK